MTSVAERWMRRAAAAVTIAAIIAAAALLAFGRDGARIDVLDVGQGDAILLTDGSTQLLVDQGRDGTVLAALGAAMPFFDRELEGVLITHPDQDHYRGLLWVQERYRIGTLYIAAHAEQPPLYAAALDRAAALGTERRVVAAGDSIRVGDRLVADVLWPSVDATIRERNEGAIVLRVRDARAASDAPALALLTADAGLPTEAALVDAAVDLRAQVLKVGHHGSKSSSGTSFLSAVGARDAIVSVGADNRYGHPAFAVLRRLVTDGYRVWRTDIAGSIRITPRSDGVRVRSCRVICLP